MTKQIIFDGLKEIIGSRNEYTQKEYETALVEYHKEYEDAISPEEWKDMIRKIQYDLLSL